MKNIKEEGNKRKCRGEKKQIRLEERQKMEINERNGR